MTFMKTWEMFRRLSDTNKFRIIHLLAQEPHKPTEISQKTGIKRSTISTDLISLKEMGLVDATWDGKNRIYTLPDSYPTPLHELALSMILITEVKLRARPSEEELESAELPDELVRNLQNRRFSEIGKHILNQIFVPQSLGQRKKSLDELQTKLQEINSKLE